MSEFAEGFMIGQVRLTPKLVDITTLQVDALVQPSGTSHHEKIIEASPWVIKSDNDGSITKELSRHTPLKLGDVIVTSAGNLNARYLLSAVVIDWAFQHTSGHLVNDEIVTSAIKKCIAIAVALGLKSIAFTPWGTRTAGQDAARTTAIMLQALSTELQKLQDQSGELANVYLVSNQQKHYQWFADRMFVFHLFYDQIAMVRGMVQELDIPQSQRKNLLGLLNNLQTNIVVYNEVVGGDKISTGDIKNTTGVALGESASATAYKDFSE